MAVLVVEKPTAQLLDRELLKTHCGIDADDEDALLDQIIATVGEVLDNPNGPTGVAIREQTLEMRLAGFPCQGFELAARPVAEDATVTVKYFDSANLLQTLAPSAYFVAQTVDASTILPAAGSAFPATFARPDAVRVQFDAGYAEDEIPARYRQAALLYGADLYDARETFREGVVTKVPMSLGVENLLAADWRPTIA